MAPRFLVTAVVSAGIVVASVASPVVSAGQRNPGQLNAGQFNAGQSLAQAAYEQDDVPCPTVKVPPNPPAPAPSPLPVRDRSKPAIGGDALDTAGLAVPEAASDVPHNLSATSWVVADLDTGDVIGACGPHEYGAPASLQKLLLAATVMPKLDPARNVTITQEDLDFEKGSSSVGLILGGTYTVATIWLGLLLNSGNDAANTLARLGGGDRGVAGTLADMNDEAKRLGARDTHAETPSGLDGPGQVTSAYDLALIARACFGRDDFSKYAASKLAQMPPEPPKDPKGYQIQNDNELLFKYPGAIGGKTGFTDIARHTFVGAAQRDGRRLVVTLLGAEHQPIKTWQQGAALLDWGFGVPKGSAVGHLVEPGELDKHLAAAENTPSPSPLARQVTTPASSSRNTTVLGAGAAAVIFAIVWVGAALAFRRRSRRRARATGSGVAD